MYHFFVEPDQVSDGQIIIYGSDVNHIRQVLRMKAGEHIRISDGTNMEYECEIADVQAESICVTILKKEASFHELPADIYLFQALPKSDKLEWVIQKAVELGVHAIIPMETERIIVKLDDKKKETKHKRWNAIAESAAKQSGRTIVPKVHSVMLWKDAIHYVKDFEQKWIPYELERGIFETQKALLSVKQNTSIAVFIGPEGGFSKEEIDFAKEHGLLSISLGQRILRTETAGLAILSALMLQLEMIGGV